jgi:hypothetical protein
LNHFAFEAAVWYWHFVDVIWILLYLLVYLWPNAKFFGSKGSITYIPPSDLTVITINTKYFYFHCNQEPGFQFYGGINFELHYDIKEKVLRFILNHFAPELENFEKMNLRSLNYFWYPKFRDLTREAGW